MSTVFDPFHAFGTTAQIIADDYASAEYLETLRAQRLARLVQTCKQHSPLYRTRLRNIDPTSSRLVDLPTVHRDELMGQFDAWVTDPRIRIDQLSEFVAQPKTIGTPYLGDYVVWQSSGSSGTPGIFVQNAEAMAVYDALEAVRGPFTRWATSPFGAGGLWGSIVFIGATNGHFASTVTIERLRRLNPFLNGRLHSLSFLQPLSHLIQQLERLQPAVITTYPSVALQLAEERLAGRLDSCPREVWVGGETLAAASREFIEQALGCRVRNSYGASEFLSIALECPHGAMHVNAEWVILEPVDDRGLPVALDTPSTSVLLTNLANHVQPLLRYVLSDRITLRSNSCACGSTLPVVDVHGRDDDVLCLPGSAGRTVSILPLALTTVVEDEAGLYDFQLLQTAPDKLTLRTRRRGRQAAADLLRATQALISFLAKFGVSHVRIQRQTGAQIVPEPSGKARQVVSLCDQSTGSKAQR